MSGCASIQLTRVWPEAKSFATAEQDQFLGAFADRDHIANLALEARDVDLAAVDLDVSVTNNLARLAARNRKTEAVSNVVETRLELLQEQFAGDAGLVGSLLVVGAELGLEREVDALGLLLLAKLQTVADNLLDLLGLAVLSRGEVALFDGALVAKALRSLEEEFLTRRGGKGGRRVLYNVPFLFLLILQVVDRFTRWQRFVAIRLADKLNQLSSVTGVRNFAPAATARSCPRAEAVLTLCGASADGSRCAASA